MDFWGVLATHDGKLLLAGGVLGLLVGVMVTVIVYGSLRGRFARRARRAARRLERARRYVAKHSGVRSASSPVPFARRVGEVRPIDTTGFVQPPGPRDWTPGG